VSNTDSPANPYFGDVRAIDPEDATGIEDGPIAAALDPLPEDEAHVRLAPEVHLRIGRPLPIRHATGRIVSAGQHTTDPAAPNTPVAIGVQPSNVSAQSIAGMYVWAVDGAVDIASDRSAGPAGRAPLDAADTIGALWLPGVPGVFVWPDTAPGTVAWLVVGGVH